MLAVASFGHYEATQCWPNSAMVCSGPCYLSQGLECSRYLKKSVKVWESVKEQVAHEEATVSCCTLSSIGGAPVTCKGQQVWAKGFSCLDVYSRGGGIEEMCTRR